MAQGTRGRWMRLTATGFGVLLCTGLVGCWNTDKPKDTKTTPKPGLPKTTILDAQGNPINTPTQNSALRGTGSNIQQTSGLSNSAMGMGNRYPTDGRNTNTGSAVQPNGYDNPMSNMPQGPTGAIVSPALPGTVQPPAPSGRYGGAASQYQNNSVGNVTGGIPPPPPLTAIPQPPAPPSSFGPSDYGNTGPTPPLPPPSSVSPIAPIAPPSMPPAPGKSTSFGSVGG